MKTRQKQSELQKRINIIKILRELEELKVSLSLYARSEHLKKHRYEVYTELEQLNQAIKELKIQLEELVENSKRWERLD